MARAVVLWLRRRDRRHAGLGLGAAAGLLGLVVVLASGAGHSTGQRPKSGTLIPMAGRLDPTRHDDGSGTDRPDSSPVSTAPATSATGGAAPSTPSATAVSAVPPDCGPAALAVTTSTDRASYMGGQPIAIYSTVKNVSSQPCLGPATCNGIAVTVNGDQGWSSDAGPRVMGCAVPPGWHPPALEPGQSESESVWWDQSRIQFCFYCHPATDYAPSGRYTATASWGVGLQGTSPPFSIAVPGCTAADLALSLTTDRTSYTAGQPVHLTATVVPRRSSEVATCVMTRGGADPTFTATNGPVQVWKSCTSGGCPPPETIVVGPRTSVEMTATWDQSTCAASGGCTRAPAGTYTVTADWGSLGSVSQSIMLQ